MTQDAILNAALEVFATEGMYAARMETIAARAGVSVGTLYNYFTDKSTLFDELVRARHQALIERIDLVLHETASLPFEQQLERYTRACFEHFTTQKKLFALLMQAEKMRLEKGFPPAKFDAHNTMQEMHRRAAELVERGVKLRALRPDFGKLLTTFFVGTVRGVLVRASLYDEDVGPADHMSRLIVEFFLHGAGAQSKA